MKLKSDLTTTEIQVANHIKDDIAALMFLKKIEDDYSARYTSRSLCEDENVGTVASKLCDLDFFEKPEDVIYFYNNSYKYVDEANKVDFVSECKDAVIYAKDIDKDQTSNILNWIETLWIAKTFDIEEQIAQLEDDLALYTEAE